MLYLYIINAQNRILEQVQKQSKEVGIVRFCTTKGNVEDILHTIFQISHNIFVK